MIAPSTHRISSASGTNDVTSIMNTSPTGTLPSSLGSGGARCGLKIARIMTYTQYIPASRKPGTIAAA